MVKQFKAIVLLFFCVTTGALKAQPVKDFGIWASVGYGKDISDKFDISLSQEVRMEENALLMGRTFTQLGLDYKLKRWIRFGLNYRFTLNRRGDGTYGHRHRIMTDLVLRTYQRQFTITYRGRLQSEVRTWNYPREFGFAPVWDLRNTLKVNYRLNRFIEPYVNLDLRFLLRDPDVPRFSGVDRTRLVVGADLLLAEGRVLGLFFLTNQYWNIDDGRRIYVFGMEFNFGSDRPLIGN